MINITEAAQEYLAELLAKQDVKDIAVRIFILDAGTPRAYSHPNIRLANARENVTATKRTR